MQITYDGCVVVDYLINTDLKFLITINPLEIIRNDGTLIHTCPLL